MKLRRTVSLPLTHSTESRIFMKRLILYIAVLTIGVFLGASIVGHEAGARIDKSGAKLCALKTSGTVRYTSSKCRKTETTVSLSGNQLQWDSFEQINKSLAPTVKTKKIAIEYLGIPNSRFALSPGCGSTSTLGDATGQSVETLSAQWIFGPGITPPSNMATLTVDPRVLADGMNWKQVARCRLELVVVVPG